MSEHKLVTAIDSLVFKYRLMSDGSYPTLLILPRRKQFVKDFCEGVSEATGGEAGSAARIFDRIWRLRDECSFRDLRIVMGDQDDMGVGNPLQ